MPFDALPGAHVVHRRAELLERQRIAEQRARVYRAAGQQVNGRAEAAQDGHGPGDGELVVVDPERRDADHGLGRGYTEDQHPPAPVEQPDRGLDRRWYPGRIDRDLERGAVKLGGVGDRLGGAELARHLEPVGDPVHDGDRASSGVQQQLQEQQPHRARPDHDRGVARHRAEAAQAMHRACQRFGHRPHLPIQVAGQKVGVDRGHRDVFGERAAYRVADRVPVLAQVVPPGPALPAVPAEQRRVHRDPGALRQVGLDVRAPGHHRPGELVAGRDGVGSRWELTRQNVQVRAADPAAVHLDDDFAGPGCGIRYLGCPEAAGTVYHDATHQSSIGRCGITVQAGSCSGMPTPGPGLTREAGPRLRVERENIVWLDPQRYRLSRGRWFSSLAAGRSGSTLPASWTPLSISGTVRRFIAGEPMNPATNWFTGLSYSSRGVSTCCSFPAASTATRLPMVIASTWSWVT